MEVLTEAKTIEFLERLKRGVPAKKETNLNILEPRAYEVILRELQPKKVLEVGCKSNSCSQVCEKLQIKHQGMAAFEFLKLDSWSGSILVNKVTQSQQISVLKHALKIKRDTQFLATCQPYYFLEATKRVEVLFKPQPFSTMYCINGLRFQVSKNGKFDCFNKGFSQPQAWFVWDNSKTKNQIKWLEDLYDYYILNEEGKPMRERIENGSWYVSYKRPIEVKKK